MQKKDKHTIEEDGPAIEEDNVRVKIVTKPSTDKPAVQAVIIPVSERERIETNVVPQNDTFISINNGECANPSPIQQNHLPSPYFSDPVSNTGILPSDLYYTGSIIELKQSDHDFRHIHIFSHIINI